MKNILFTLILLLPLFGCSQTNFNEMTESEFYNISIENVTLAQLSNFQGNIDDLAQLFNTSFTNTSNDPEEEAKEYENDDILISYFGYSPEMELSAIHVKTAEINTTINGTNIHIGDNASLLGYGDTAFNSFLNVNDSLIRYAIFKPEHHDSYVVLKFNNSNGLILEIKYISPS